MSNNKKNNTWIKKRHEIFTRIGRIPLRVYCFFKFGARVETFKDQGDRAYLIMYNHQTSFDQFFVALGFKSAVYYVATEDIFSLGWVSNIIRWLVAPIPIRKQTTDLKAVKTCIKVAREGGSIAIAPEGNRTYSGKLCYINPAIASMAKKIGLPIAIFRIEGGYGVQPRWSDVNRKGTINARVSRVIEPEEYKGMSNEELMEVLCEELNVNEACVAGEFRHQKSAEYLERVAYVCPECGLSVFRSQDDIIECTKCGLKAKYLPTRQLVGVEKEFPFEFVADWYEYQEKFVNGMNLLEGDNVEPLFKDTANISQVIVYEKKVPLAENVEICLYKDKLVLSDGGEGQPVEMAFSDVSTITVLGRNKLNIYYDVNGKIYQVKGDKRFNGLKYVHLFNRYKNQLKGDEHVEFLGL